MIVTLKTLQQETFFIEIDTERTVLDLKEEIFKKLGGEYRVEKQKLIYSGVILLDDRSLASYNVEEHKFIVVMINRGNTENSKELIRTNEPVTESQNVATETLHESINAIPQNVASEFVVGEEYNSAVEALVEMGFDRVAVENAMAASFNNPERAFEYLNNGIPDIPETLEVGSNDGINSINEFLDLMRQNPTLLRAALEQIGLTDPSLIQRIVDNPEIFLSLFRHAGDNENSQNGVSQERLNSFTHSPVGNNNRTEVDGGISHAGNPRNFTQTGGTSLPNASSIPLTPDDLNAIERIKAMGFPEELVIQSFIACEKNEELTVNLLLANDDD